MAMLSFERKYRVRGGTLIGGDLFDFWVGPFYVGFFGVTTIFFVVARHGADLSTARRMGPTWNLWQIIIAPPDLSYGLGFAPLQEGGSGRSSRSAPSAPSSPGRCAKWKSAASWASGYHVPFAFGVAIFAYVTLVVIRPICWAPGATASRTASQPPRLGVEHRLPVLHFHYNPAHMLAITFFFTTTLALALHGALILSAVNPTKGEAVKTAGTREHLLPRHHRLLDRHARHPPPRPVPGA